MNLPVSTGVDSRRTDGMRDERQRRSSRSRIYFAGRDVKKKQGLLPSSECVNRYLDILGYIRVYFIEELNTPHSSYFSKTSIIPITMLNQILYICAPMNTASARPLIKDGYMQSRWIELCKIIKILSIVFFISRRKVEKSCGAGKTCSRWAENVFPDGRGELFQKTTFERGFLKSKKIELS